MTPIPQQFTSECFKPNIIHYVNEDQFEDYKCPICLNIINGSVFITECGHSFCDSCLMEHLKCNNPLSFLDAIQSITAEKSCPLCRGHIAPDLTNVTFSKQKTEYLNSLPVKCHNIDCSVILSRREYLLTHLNSCEFNKVQCVSCADITIEKYKEEHIKNCIKQPQMCTCGIFYAKDQYETHLKDVCMYGIDKCKYPTCEYSATRKTVLFHEQVCKHRITQCHSCNESIRVMDIEIHMKRCKNKIIKCRHCSQFVNLQTLHMHNQICKKQMAECDICFKIVPKNNFSMHREMCQMIIIKCPFCNEYYQWNKKAEHRTTCSPNLTLFESNSIRLDSESGRNLWTVDYGNIANSLSDGISGPL